jgi:pre-60S factor REI1
MLDEHKKSKKHKKSEKAYLAKNPDATESSIFKSISFDVTGGTSFLSDLQRSVNGEAELTLEEDTEAQKNRVPTKTTLDSLRICLFSNKESDGVKKNLDYMAKKHNFRILDIECLTSLKGLLSYIAERIQLGSLCLYCSKQFKNPQRC